MALVTERERIGNEGRARLLDDGQPRVYGELTAALVTFLDQADPLRATVADLEHILRQHFDQNVVIRIADRPAPGPCFTSEDHRRAVQAVVELEPWPLRAIVAVLERVIAAREQRDDYWPEGRLNAGIALAALGEYEAAHRRLDEAVDLLSGGDLHMREAAAA